MQIDLTRDTTAKEQHRYFHYYQQGLYRSSKYSLEEECYGLRLVLEVDTTPPGDRRGEEAVAHEQDKVRTFRLDLVQRIEDVLFINEPEVRITCPAQWEIEIERELRQYWEDRREIVPEKEEEKEGLVRESHCYIYHKHRAYQDSQFSPVKTCSGLGLRVGIDWRGVKGGRSIYPNKFERFAGNSYTLFALEFSYSIEETLLGLDPKISITCPEEWEIERCDAADPLTLKGSL